MKWKITYRDKDGKYAYDFIEAENRNSLFKLIKAKGINVIKIEQSQQKSLLSKGQKKVYIIISSIIVIVILFVISLITLLGKENIPHKIKNPPKKTISQKRIPSKKNNIKPVAKEDSISIKKDKPTKIGEVVNGYVMLPSGRIHRRLGVVTNSIANRPKGKYAIFSRSCNNEIACYLTLKPGSIILGDFQHNGRFKQDFIESLNEPIEITKEDSQEQAQLKRDVIEARLFLKDALDRGEDIEQIMQDTRSELQDLMRFKINNEMFFREQLKNCETNQDIENLFNACNKMLEKKGIAPLTYGPITRKNLLRQKMNKKF